MIAALQLPALLLCAPMALGQGAPQADQAQAGRPHPQGFPGLAAGRSPRVEIPFNRLYDIAALYAHFDRLEAAFPDLVSHEVIGRSIEGREVRVYTVCNSATGPDREKPAMWIDGNVHGNEVQGSEAVLYALWYLVENYGSNPRITDLVDRAAFYLLPSVNPDGRDLWFAGANTASSSRSGVAPVDSDQDGLFDEDPTNDLDGDGNIVRMRKYVPGHGTHRLDPEDPRRMISVDPSVEGPPGDWVLLGTEGYDDDGDGRTNEDGPGGYDMNRAWPASWQPGHVQFGAGPYPLYWPETRGIAEFILDHPNIGGVQSYHNSGGMILRGPGTSSYGDYPRSDVAVYDELGYEGERMLPFYNYWVIWEDLYTVFGGFVTWTYEGLGVISFTNELWTDERNNPDGGWGNSTDDRLAWSDRLLFGAGHVDWTPVDHPQFGEVEVGGFVKDQGRVPPTFLLEEELHRKALFALYHAEELPEVEILEPEITDLGGGLRAVDVRFHNRRGIPTRTALAEQKRIGTPDVLELGGEGFEVLTAGSLRDRLRPERLALFDTATPERIASEGGIGAHGTSTVRWIVRGTGEARVRFASEKARDVERSFTIQ